jgi:parallel beta-helix repeat protein
MGGEGSQPTANVLLDSTGGSIGEVAIVGCTIQHTHDAPDSANVRIDGQSTARAFTKETRHGNITISDNVLSDAQVNIDLANTRGVTISGNTMWKGYANNFRANNCESIVMTGNVFDRSPRYHYKDGAAAKLGIVFDNCVGCTFSGNHIEQVGDTVAALVVRNSSHFNITGCTILDCSPCGILLENVSRSRVSDCLIDEPDASETQSMSLRANGGTANVLADNLVGCGQVISSGFSVQSQSIERMGGNQ